MQPESIQRITGISIIVLGLFILFFCLMIMQIVTPNYVVYMGIAGFLMALIAGVLIIADAGRNEY